MTLNTSVIGALAASSCLAYTHARTRSDVLITLDADFLATDLPIVLYPMQRPSGG